MLTGAPTTFVNADVALDGEPVIGSFTVDGLTFAVVGESSVELVGVSEAVGVSSRRVVASSQGLGAPDVLPDLGSTPAAPETEVEDSVLALPESIAYGDVEYSVASIGAYAFYLSGVTSVELPASVADVDERAFRSSDVASVTVADGNPAYSSFDGVLYDADRTSLLLIPEGRLGAVRMPSTTVAALPSAFSHCAGVDAISVDADGAAFASENGLLYDASLTTLLRVPAGATEITIHDGCTTIAAGAMEACASLTTINAPASVTSISPDVFTSVPTVSLPAAALAEDAPQLSAMVALSSVKDDLVEVNPSSIVVGVLQERDSSIWESVGLTVSAEPLMRELGQAGAYAAHSVYTYTFCATAEATYFVGGLGSQYGYCFNDSGVGGTHVTLSWDKGTALVPDSDAVVTVSVTGYKRSATIYPTGDYANYWKRPDCGSLIGFLSSTGENYFSASQVANDSSFQFTIFGRNVNNTGQNGSGYHMPDAFKPVFEKALHTFNLNYKDCPSPLTAYSRVRGPFVLPDEPARDGYTFKGWFDTKATTGGSQIGVAGGIETAPYFDTTFYARWEPNAYKIAFDARGGDEVASIQATYDADVTLPAPTRQGYVFKGWDTEADGTGSRYQAGVALVRPNLATSGTVKLYAQWERVDYDLGFDVDSEPGDEDYPGIEKPDETINVDDGPTFIEDPKRPGYVFQGWVIPSEDGTEAIDQDLVYQDESDGKWYVDASKLPDYANDEGRVELTARWTSVISVDVPSAVTFYADVVTEGQESREGAASSAFGQNKVASQSEVDLRIVGLESSAVETQGSTLGADSILKKATSATPSSSTQKLFSLYPTDTALTADDLQDPDAVSTTKPADAVDFALDDILLEKSFAADKFTIPAGDTLNLGYRLNLSETGTELDYDKLSTLEEGQSASIANVSYAFAATGMNMLFPSGSKSDALYVEVSQSFLDAHGLSQGADAGVYGLDDIKTAALDLAASSQPEQSDYYPLYRALLDDAYSFQLKVNGVYQAVHVVGICQDTRTDGSPAGLSFMFKDVYAHDGLTNALAGGTTFQCNYNDTYATDGRWSLMTLRNNALRAVFYSSLAPEMRDEDTGIVAVRKVTQSYPATAETTFDETIFIPSVWEIYGCAWPNHIDEEESFQYQYFAREGASLSNTSAMKTFNGRAVTWRLRSADKAGYATKGMVASSGVLQTNVANDIFHRHGIVPCFCL